MVFFEVRDVLFQPVYFKILSLSDLLIDFNFFSGPKPYAFTSAPTVGSK